MHAEVKFFLFGFTTEKCWLFLQFRGKYFRYHENCPTMTELFTDYVAEVYFALFEYPGAWIHWLLKKEKADLQDHC